VWGSGGIAPPFLVSALYRTGSLHAPAPLHQHPLYRRLDGPQSWSGRNGEQEALLPRRKSNSGRLARSQVATPNELSRLQYLSADHTSRLKRGRSGTAPRTLHIDSWLEGMVCIMFQPLYLWRERLRHQEIWGSQGGEQGGNGLLACSTV
jgi:hypothetical protein